MSRRSLLLASGVLLLLLLVGAVAIQWQRKRQPVWQGKTVGEWFVEFRKARPRHRHPITVWLHVPFGGTTNRVAQVAYSEHIDELLNDPAAKALREFGTNAVPFLEAEVRKGDSLWTRSYRRLLQKMPPGIRRHAPAASPPRYLIQQDAALALAALGKNGAAAVPAILEAYADAGHWEYLQSLSRLPTLPADLDAMLARFHGSNLHAAVTAVKALRIQTSMAARILTNAVLTGKMASEALLELHYHRAQAGIALPALSVALKSRDPQTRECAARVLRTFGPDAAGALPALTEALKSEDEELRYQSACAIEEMGTNALPAADALGQATNDPSAMVQRVATRALRNLRQPEKAETLRR